MKTGGYQKFKIRCQILITLTNRTLCIFFLVGTNRPKKKISIYNGSNTFGFFFFHLLEKKQQKNLSFQSLTFGFSNYLSYFIYAYMFKKKRKCSGKKRTVFFLTFWESHLAFFFNRDRKNNLIFKSVYFFSFFFSFFIILTKKNVYA